MTTTAKHELPDQTRNGAPATHDHRHRKPPSPADALQPVLTIRAHLEADQVPAFVRDSLHEIRGYIDEQHVEVAGPPFLISHGASLNGIDVETGWPVHRAPSNGRIESGALPIGLVRAGRDH